MKTTRLFFLMFLLLPVSLLAATSIGGKIYRNAGDTSVCVQYWPQDPTICKDEHTIINLKPVPGARLYLQSAPVGSGNYLTVDSLAADSGANYRFHFALRDSGFYRISVPMQTINGLTFSARVGSALTVYAGDSLTQGFILSTTTSAVYSGDRKRDSEIRFSINDDRLCLYLGDSKLARTIEIFNMNGSMQHRVYVSAGESQIYVPQAFAPQKGFLFRMH